MKLHELQAILKEFGNESVLQQQQLALDYLRKQNPNIDNVYQELEMTSRFVDAHQDISYGKDLVQLHSHTFYEVIYCCSNSGIQYLVGTERYRLQRGDIVFVPPGIGHKPLFTGELAEPYRRVVLWLSPEFMDFLAQTFRDMRIHPRSHQVLFRTSGTSWAALSDYFFNGLKEAEEQKIGWQAALYGNTTQLLVHLSRFTLDAGSTCHLAEKPELLDEIMTYIEQNLKQKITLKDTAKRFWVSEGTVSQTFKQKMDVSFYQFVTQRRLIAAKSMILEGMQLEEVSSQTGFSDYSTFYRAFRQAYGISPRQYRRLQDGGIN